MGKKQQGTKRSRSDSEDLDEEDADEELEAEMAVLAAIQAEKADAEGDQEGLATGKPVKKAYNREGLLQALECIGELPFVESFSISDFPIDVQDEHDDLEREVCHKQEHAITFYVLNSLSFTILLVSIDGFL